MRPAWLHTLAEGLSASSDETIIGVAIGITDPYVPLVHTGVVYKEPDERPRVLHLAFHAYLQDESLPSAQVDYHWTRLRIDADRAASLSGFCRRVAKRRPRIKYGIVYEGDRLADDGTVQLSGNAIGLTCATFVLAVLKWAGFEPLKLETWPNRNDDEAWHRHIVKMLINVHCSRPDSPTSDHIVDVAWERGCARFRPEEVAASCAFDWPVSFYDVEPEGAAARAFLLRTTQTSNNSNACMSGS